MTHRLRPGLARPAGLLGLLLAWDAARLLLPPSMDGPVAASGAAVVLLVPGVLAVTWLGARRLTLPAGLFAVGFGVLCLYLVGLGANLLPTPTGARGPLTAPLLLTLLNLLCVALAVGAARRHRRGSGPAPAGHVRPAGRTAPAWPAAALAGVAVAVPGLAVLGAVSLNNAGGNGLAVRALVLAVVLVAGTFVLRARVGDATLAIVVAGVTLALLLATSLRGWYVTGQDMQHEFQVFRLALEQGRWNPSGYRDPYNACLSVTVLPVMLSELLRLDGEWLFKVVAQALFATVPLTLFAVARRFLGPGGALTVAVLFVGLPTFSIDTPFITRQELAFVFAALAVAAVFLRSEPWLRLHRPVVLFAMAAGVVLSHYSTAYVFVPGLVTVYMMGWLRRLAARRHAKNRRRPDDGERLPGPAVLGALVLTMIWLGPVTHASGDLVAKLGASSASIGRLVHRPELVLATLGRPTGDPVSLRDYVAATTVTGPGEAERVAAGLREVSSDLPATAATRWVSERAGVNPAAGMAGFYYGLGPKLYLLCCLAGTLLLCSARVRARFGPMPVLYPMWSLTVMGMIGLQLLVPDLAGSYGVTRAFMQAFLVLGVPMVVALRLAFDQLGRAGAAAPAALSTGLLVVYCGLGPQATGGLHRQLSLDSTGQYHGTVYPQDADIAAADWIGRNLPPGSKINVADFAAVYAYHPTFAYDVTDPGVLPFQVRPRDYVMLSSTQTREHVVYTFGQLVGVAFDPDGYRHDDLLYSSGDVRVVRRR